MVLAVGVAIEAGPRHPSHWGSSRERGMDIKRGVTLQVHFLGHLWIGKGIGELRRGISF
jgi:hypothetical protein